MTGLRAVLMRSQLRVAEVLHEADVGAGGEGFFVAGEDDAADGIVGFEGVDGQADAIDDVVVEGVEHLGAVQADQADPAMGFGEHDSGHHFLQ
jgi:hypothetical protein